MPIDPNTAAAYNEYAEEYNKHVSNPNDATFHAYYEKPAIRAQLPELTGLSVISIGCGSGVDAQWLIDNGAQAVTGIDISSGLIDIAKREHPGIDFRVMDMEALDFPDETFDLAYSSLAIHYLDNWTMALSEAKRILKPASKYIFSCGHPIDSATEHKEDDTQKSNLLGRTIIRETRDRKVHGDYLAVATDGIRPIDGLIGTMPVRVFHRPVSVMIEQILASGFMIEKLVEPQPTEEMRTVDPQIYNQLTKIPSSMIWVLRK